VLRENSEPNEHLCWCSIRTAVCLSPDSQSLTPSLRTTLAANSWLRREGCITLRCLTWSLSYNSKCHRCFEFELRQAELSESESDSSESKRHWIAYAKTDAVQSLVHQPPGDRTRSSFAPLADVGLLAVVWRTGMVRLPKSYGRRTYGTHGYRQYSQLFGHFTTFKTVWTVWTILSSLLCISGSE
jgi:hypothetical protein